MEFEYRRSKSAFLIFAIFSIVFGIVFINQKRTYNYSIFILILIINMIMQFVNYLIMKRKGMGIVEYLDYEHATKSLIVMYGAIIFIVVISGENANYVVGVLMLILAIMLIIEGGIFRKSNDTKGGRVPIDKIILNEDGIKIPSYKFIMWEDISNVLEYEAGRNSIIGVLVSNERAYKINNSKIEDLLFGKNKRLITIIRDSVSGKHGIGASELVVAMKENMKG